MDRQRAVASSARKGGRFELVPPLPQDRWFNQRSSSMNKNHGIVRYLEFLVARDGDADLLRRRLSKREAFFDNLARSPVSSYALIDHATYLRNMARRRPEPGLEPRMLWILATAKANQAERLGVGLSELLGR